MQVVPSGFGTKKGSCSQRSSFHGAFLLCTCPLVVETEQDGDWKWKMERKMLVEPHRFASLKIKLNITNTGPDLSTPYV